MPCRPGCRSWVYGSGRRKALGGGTTHELYCFPLGSSRRHRTRPGRASFRLPRWASCSSRPRPAGTGAGAPLDASPRREARPEAGAVRILLIMDTHGQLGAINEPAREARLEGVHCPQPGGEPGLARGPRGCLRKTWEAVRERKEDSRSVGCSRSVWASSRRYPTEAGWWDGTAQSPSGSATSSASTSPTRHRDTLCW